MNTKELKNIKGLDEKTTVTIWEMNYGFRSDLQGASTVVNVGEKTSVDFAKVRIYTLVYGIYEASELGINKPKDVELGLDAGEIKERTIAVRKLNSSTAEKLYDEVNKINKEVEEKVVKKSSSPLTEKSSEIQE